MIRIFYYINSVLEDLTVDTDDRRVAIIIPTFFEIITSPQDSH